MFEMFEEFVQLFGFFCKFVLCVFWGVDKKGMREG